MSDANWQIVCEVQTHHRLTSEAAVLASDLRTRSQRGCQARLLLKLSPTSARLRRGSMSAETMRAVGRSGQPMPSSDASPAIAFGAPAVPQQDHAMRRMTCILLIVTAATGAIDAVSILHFHAFTAFVTGTIVLLGAEIVGQAQAGLAKAIVVAAFFVGAIVGGRLMRRHLSTERLLADSLYVAATLVGLAALMIGVLDSEQPPVRWTTIGLLAFAMGAQTSATRHAHVPDMLLPLVTLVVHGLAHDSHLAGGRSEHTLRRVGIVLALMAGAASGAALAAWHLWAALLLSAVLLTLAGMLVRAIRDQIRI
jgi:uncharacterized membrane protein YoaK (UPF0700 family)